jgi:CheY-like chemotaxis protein
MDPKSILLVDNHSEDLQETMCALNERGMVDDVLAVHDGSEALNYLRRTAACVQERSGDPLVMLLHLHMPCLKGLDVLRHIREDPRLPRLPVVVTVPYGRPELAGACELGVEADIDEPDEFEKLVDVVKQIGVLCLLLEPPQLGN